MQANQKIMTAIAVAAAIAAGILTAWIFRSRNTPLPSLKQIAGMEDAAFLNSVVADYRRQDLHALWGEPDESSAMQEIWYIDDNTKLIVNYMNNDDRPVICGIERIE